MLLITARVWNLSFNVLSAHSQIPCAETTPQSYSTLGMCGQEDEGFFLSTAPSLAMVSPPGVLVPAYLTSPHPGLQTLFLVQSG